MRILGIDPGLAIVGFGLIEAETGKTQMLQYGAVTTPAGLPLAARLVQLERDMEELIAQLRAAANVDEVPLVRYEFDVFVPAGAWEGGV